MAWRARLMWLFIVAFAGIVVPAQADPPAGYPFHTYDEGLALARSQHKPVFVYFGRYGCGWCEKTNKEAFSQAAVREAYIQHYVLVYVDTESGKRVTLSTGERLTEMELAARYKVIATPVFAYLQPDAQLIFKIPGMQSAADFQGYDRFVHGGYYRREGIREFLVKQHKS